MTSPAGAQGRRLSRLLILCRGDSEKIAPWLEERDFRWVATCGMLHLIFWFIAALFGVRLLGMLMDQLRVTGRFHVGVWVVIFFLVNLQMITALRPIIGRAPTLLPTEKKFFLAHWAETVNRGN